MMSPARIAQISYFNLTILGKLGSLETTLPTSVPFEVNQRGFHVRFTRKPSFLALCQKLNRRFVLLSMIMLGSQQSFLKLLQFLAAVLALVLGKLFSLLSHLLL